MSDIVEDTEQSLDFTPNREALAEESLSIDSIYEQFTLLEKKPGNPDDLIPYFRLDPNSDEYRTLRAAGFSEDDLVEHRIRRGDLLKAGFVFDNRLFLSMERPIIDYVIDGVDYGSKRFLTRAELDKIVEYQREHPDEFGGPEIASDQFRRDMLSLLLTARTIPGWIKAKKNFLRLSVAHIPREYDLDGKPFNLSPEEIDERKNQQNIVREYLDVVDEDEVLASDLATVMPWEDIQRNTFYSLQVRGRLASAHDGRQSALSGFHSPFLESGFIFPPFTPDLEVVNKAEDGRFRVNLLVWHLLSHGLSEMGRGKDPNDPQDYTIDNYIHEMYPEDEGQREAIREKENAAFDVLINFDKNKLMKNVQDRLIQRAQEWRDSQSRIKRAMQAIRSFRK